MDDLIIWMIEKFGWGALVIGILMYLVIEGGLDIITDIISDKIREKKNDRSSS